MTAKKKTLLSVKRVEKLERVIVHQKNKAIAEYKLNRPTSSELQEVARQNLLAAGHDIDEEVYELKTRAAQLVDLGVITREVVNLANLNPAFVALGVQTKADDELKALGEYYDNKISQLWLCETLGEATALLDYKANGELV